MQTPPPSAHARYGWVGGFSQRRVPERAPIERFSSERTTEYSDGDEE